ncbi:potassium channel family protein [Kosmotoga pacifica]|uniref:Potassium transporter TrkA n=1 Tax=Kosmotoga pacifica TaxID=1330330 RepID=A0A0G2Z535_9BACT|nr:potassium channel protein [Kosmotoga pacifica]AKI96725.1 potassium transporter TrkA [Kosmotoga pacifica]
MIERTREVKSILFAVLYLVIVFLSGMFGYAIIEGWSLTDSFFMTVITVSTVGYGTPEDLSAAGKIFTSILIFTSITLGVYAISKITAFFVEGKMSYALRRRRMLKELERMKDHFIVVGAGTIGLSIAKMLSERGFKVILVDNDPARIEYIEDISEDGLICFKGDAVNEEVLKQIGVDHAAGLITTLPVDADNVFVVLTARQLNPSLEIIAKANEVENIKKLRYAGASKVLPIPEIGARRMVNLILNPSIEGFLDTLIESGDMQVYFEQVSVPDSFPSEGVELGELKIPQKTGLIVIAIYDGGKSMFNPRANALIKPGQALMVLGKKEQIEKLKLLLKH